MNRYEKRFLALAAAAGVTLSCVRPAFAMHIMEG